MATKNHRWRAIEAEGYPSTTYEHGPTRGRPKPTQPTNQARQWFSHALLGTILLRDKRPDAEIAIAFPRFKTNENRVERTKVPFGLLGFGVYFVNENGSVMATVKISQPPHRRVEEPIVVQRGNIRSLGPALLAVRLR